MTARDECEPCERAYHDFLREENIALEDGGEHTEYKVSQHFRAGYRAALERAAGEIEETCPDGRLSYDLAAAIRALADAK